MPHFLSSILRNYHRKLRPDAVLLLAGMLISVPADAAVIAGLSPGDSSHRFDAMGNPNSIFKLSESAVRGIGTGARATLITQRHYVTAVHSPSATARFRRADGVIQTYSTSDTTPFRLTTVDDGDVVGASDIFVYTLNEEIPVSDVQALAVIDADSTNDYQVMNGQTLFVYDRFDRVGRNIVDDVVIAEFEMGSPNPSFNVMYDFDTPMDGGLSDEARLESGDSGWPVLIDVNGTLGVVGTHFGVDNSMGEFQSFSTFLAPYLDDIETFTLATDGGYALNRVSVVAVPEPTLWFSTAILGICLRRRTKRLRS